MAAARAPSASQKEQIFEMAEKEMEYRTEMFSKLTKTCFSKCVENRYKESELNMAENSCIDKCVSKYNQVAHCSRKSDGLRGAGGEMSQNSNEPKNKFCETTRKAKLVIISGKHTNIGCKFRGGIALRCVAPLSVNKASVLSLLVMVTALAVTSNQASELFLHGIMSER